MKEAILNINSLDYDKIHTLLSDIFGTEILEKLARESRFIERSTSKLDGWMFLELHVLMEADGKEWSLTEMCERIYELHGVELAKQSLDERFNTYAVRFMRSCFELVFRKILGYGHNPPTHACFERVVLTDSTSFQLPSHLSAFYQGNGGSNSGSSIKIHQQYDLLSGRVLDLQFRDGKEGDAAFLGGYDYQHVGKELHLMDLGYYKTSHLEAMDAAGGFFISRYKTGTTLYVKGAVGYERLDWQALLSGCGHTLHLPEVYLGEEKVRARLIVDKLSDGAVNRRRAKLRAKEANQSKGRGRAWKASGLKRLLMGYSIFITNTTDEQLTVEQVQLYYGLRWQIELLFKVWKSVLELDKVGKMSIFRFECYLYGRLLVLLLSTYVQNLMKDAIKQKGDAELSNWKGIKYLKKRLYNSVGHCAVG